MPNAVLARAVVDAQSIERDRVYRLEDFMRITGKGRHAMRAARANGLRVIKDGVHKYVTGADWFDYLDRRSRESSD